MSQGATHWNAGLQPLLHAHVVQEDEALERQSEGSARSTLCSADKRREVEAGTSAYALCLRIACPEEYSEGGMHAACTSTSTSSMRMYIWYLK